MDKMQPCHGSPEMAGNQQRSARGRTAVLDGLQGPRVSRDNSGYEPFAALGFGLDLDPDLGIHPVLLQGCFGPCGAFHRHRQQFGDSALDRDLIAVT